MSKPKKPARGRPKTDRPTVNVAARLYVEVNAALELLAEKHRRTKSAEIALAVEAWLERYRDEVK